MEHSEIFKLLFFIIGVFLIFSKDFNPSQKTKRQLKKEEKRKAKKQELKIFQEDFENETT